MAGRRPGNGSCSQDIKVHDVTAMSVIAEFDIPSAIPLDGDISFSDLASRIGIDANRLERIMRLMFLQQVFTETRPGHVGHSPTSALMAQQPPLVAIFRHLTTAGFRGGSYLAEALRKFPNSSESTKTGFPLAYSSPAPFFGYLSQNPAVAANFHQGMIGVNTLLGRSPRDDIDSYDWKGLGENATVVDVSNA